MELNELKSRLGELLPRLKQQYGVSGLWIFGSRARGESAEGSDVDLLVDFDRRGISLFKFVGIELEVEDALGLRVDLVQKSALRAEIAPQVLKEAQPV